MTSLEWVAGFSVVLWRSVRYPRIDFDSRGLTVSLRSLHRLRWDLPSLQPYHGPHHRSRWLPDI